MNIAPGLDGVALNPDVTWCTLKSANQPLSTGSPVTEKSLSVGVEGRTSQAQGSLSCKFGMPSRHLHSAVERICIGIHCFNVGPGTSSALTWLRRFSKAARRMTWCCATSCDISVYICSEAFLQENGNYVIKEKRFEGSHTCKHVPETVLNCQYICL